MDAAGNVMLAAVEQQVEAAERQPEQAIPTLPFGDEKGKLLHKAHPKWTVILAKKSDEDARSFQDLVLYRVAKSLNVRRGGGRTS